MSDDSGPTTKDRIQRRLLNNTTIAVVVVAAAALAGFVALLKNVDFLQQRFGGPPAVVLRNAFELGKDVGELSWRRLGPLSEFDTVHAPALDSVKATTLEHQRRAETRIKQLKLEFDIGAYPMSLDLTAVPRRDFDRNSLARTLRELIDVQHGPKAASAFELGFHIRCFFWMFMGHERRILNLGTDSERRTRGERMVVTINEAARTLGIDKRLAPDLWLDEMGYVDLGHFQIDVDRWFEHR